MATAPRKAPATAQKTARTPATKPMPEAQKPAEVKTKKPKLVRDSFTIPKNEYGHIEALKQRTALLGNPAKKSELIRAGIQLLTTLNDAQLRKALAQIPTVKTGRPVKTK